MWVNALRTAIMPDRWLTLVIIVRQAPTSSGEWLPAKPSHGGLARAARHDGLTRAG